MRSTDGFELTLDEHVATLTLDRPATRMSGEPRSERSGGPRDEAARGAE
ncbi:hypothetical protein AB0O28_14415 [Microbispora sp. NPDC088329]